MKPGICALTAAALLVVNLGCETTGVTPPPPPPPEGAEKLGFSERPPDSKEMTVQIGEGSMQLFRAADFKNDSESLRLADFEAATVHDHLGKVKDKMSSLRWNLPAGAVVVFYQHAGGKGRQLAIWGNGEHSSISRWNMNDCVSRWAWFPIGGTRAGGPVSEFPLDAHEPTETVDPLTVNIFQNTRLRGDREPITPVTGYPPRQYLPVGTTFDRASSVNWNLPPGVVVLLHQHSAGRGDMLALWGHGQFDGLKAQSFNDRLSRWSWHYIGDK